MGLWNILESAGLVESQETPEEAAPAGHPSSAPVVGQGTSMGKPVSAWPGPGTATAPIDAERIAQLDNAARTLLLNAVREAEVQSVTDLSDLLDTLRDAIPDEKTLYTKALSLLGKKGISAHQIVGDYDKCIGVLEASARDFQAHQKAQQDSRIGTRIKVIEDCNRLAQLKTDQIAALQKEVADLQTKASTEQASIAGEQAKIAQVQDRFTLVYKAMRGEIESQRSKVTTHGAVS